MVTDIAERLNLKPSADKEQQKKELRKCKQLVSEIENLYAKLYEDMTRELITEKRFQMLSHDMTASSYLPLSSLRSR